MKVNRKKLLFKILLYPFINTLICGTVLAAVTIFISEDAKIKTVWLAVGGIYIFFFIFFFILNFIFTMRFRKVFSKKTTRESVEDKHLKRMFSLPKKMYITSTVIYTLAPALYSAIQFIRETPPAMGSVYILTFCSLGLGIVAGNLYHLYLMPIMIHIAHSLKQPFMRMQLKHKIILPVINLLIVLLVALSIYSYKSSLLLYEPTAMNSDLLTFKLGIKNIQEDYRKKPETNISAFFLERIKSDNLLSEDFLFHSE